MKGLLIWASTDRSARVCATSDREMMWALRMVLRAYIRCVSFFLRFVSMRHWKQLQVDLLDLHNLAKTPLTDNLE
jgi:hypothetical protein